MPPKRVAGESTGWTDEAKVKPQDLIYYAIAHKILAGICDKILLLTSSG